MLLVTNTASDGDIPALQLTYELIGPPAGAAIDTNGVITWTPSEAQGPSTYTITTVVTDSGQPQLSVTNSFNVMVNEVNRAPTLPFQQNRKMVSSTLLVVTNTATDPDLPPNHIFYSLLSPPAGAAIDTNGIITWTAPATAELQSNQFITVATDDGIPALSATNQFTITVIPPASLPAILSVELAGNLATVTWNAVPATLTNSNTKTIFSAPIGPQSFPPSPRPIPQPPPRTRLTAPSAASTACPSCSSAYFSYLHHVVAL
jgi:hypothetical protein